MTLTQLKQAFLQDHQHLLDAGMVFHGVSCEPFPKDEEHDPVEPSACTIHVGHPFIFPVQRIPPSYQGAPVQKGMQGSRSDVLIDHPDYFPPEFDVDPHAAFIPLPAYWAPAKFEAFVDRCAPDIRRIRKDPSLTREQMLDMLAFGDFAELQRDVDGEGGGSV
jgi:hypothetical protein